MRTTRDRVTIAALASALMLTGAHAQSTVTDIGTLDAQTVLPGKPPGYSPYAGRNFPSRVFWGDTIFIPAPRWTPAPSAPGSASRMPTVSHAARN